MVSLTIAGSPLEPPLWLGPSAKPARYVRWAIGYAHALGLPFRKLSAQAVIGDAFVESEPPSGPDATDSHLWSPLSVLKTIFDDLGVPHDQRTYAVSLYEHRKCLTVPDPSCVDATPHQWAAETLQRALNRVGRGNGSRIVAVEMGIMAPTEAGWNTEQALESLISLMYEYNIDGGCFWRWTSFSNEEDADPTLAVPVRRRGVAPAYTHVKDVLTRLYTQR